MAEWDSIFFLKKDHRAVIAIKRLLWKIASQSHFSSEKVSPMFNFLSSHQPVIVIKNFSFFVEKNVRWLVGCSCVEVGPIKVLFKKEVKFNFLCLKINGFDHFLNRNRKQYLLYKRALVKIFVSLSHQTQYR